MRVNKRLYKSVSSSNSEDVSHTPANGKKLFVYRMGGNAAGSPDTSVIIVWDDGGSEEEIIFTTHGDALHLLEQNLEFTGDGSKTLKIILENDAQISHSMGGFFDAFEED